MSPRLQGHGSNPPPYCLLTRVRPTMTSGSNLAGPCFSLACKLRMALTFLNGSGTSFFKKKTICDMWQFYETQVPVPTNTWMSQQVKLLCQFLSVYSQLLSHLLVEGKQKGFGLAQVLGLHWGALLESTPPWPPLAVFLATEWGFCGARSSSHKEVACPGDPTLGILDLETTPRVQVGLLLRFMLATMCTSSHEGQLFVMLWMEREAERAVGLGPLCMSCHVWMQNSEQSGKSFGH